ncbi:hypothetical protein U370_00075 [Anaplasma marginale str. Dawn]|nr:hypothetical protein U370_00075 [Anaplasma marginale str. Dawn]
MAAARIFVKIIVARGMEFPILAFDAMFLVLCQHKNAGTWSRLHFAAFIKICY